MSVKGVNCEYYFEKTDIQRGKYCFSLSKLRAIKLKESIELNIFAFIMTET